MIQLESCSKQLEKTTQKRTTGSFEKAKTEYESEIKVHEPLNNTKTKKANRVTIYKCTHKLRLFQYFKIITPKTEKPPTGKG